jgi:hypothetical protein
LLRVSGPTRIHPLADLHIDPAFAVTVWFLHAYLKTDSRAEQPFDLIPKPPRITSDTAARRAKIKTNA